eukprot:Sdes_comp20449_c0_seq1m14641
MTTKASKKPNHLPSQNSSNFHYEFGGPLGALGVILGLPLVAYVLFFACNSHGCLQISPSFADESQGWSNLLTNYQNFEKFSITSPPWSIPTWKQLFSWKLFAVYTAWWAFQALLYMTLPGQTVKGVVLANGSRLDYYMNGFLAFFLSIFLFFLGGYFQIFSWTFFYDHFLQLLSSSILFSFTLSTFLYAKSRLENSDLASHGNSGNTIYDFFMGRQLNPRIGNFDLKYFCELRPGLILWVLINLSMIAKQYETHQTVSNSILLTTSFQFWYVLDCFTVESAVLTTMDIIQDGFGFMLAFGDLAWVPFVYSLQCRYLVENPSSLPTFQVGLILLVQLTGYFIFRSANSQKDTFRKDPNHPSVSALKYLKTDSGSRLLISGWWGISRHINYFGDWLMGVAWCLPCGFNSPVPYFYSVYFAILLLHRQQRDDEKCSKKYGNDWKKYCQLVPYKIIPFLY